MKNLLSFLSFIALTAHSQSFQKAYGGGSDEFGMGCIVTSDGGYLMTGESTYGGGGLNIYLVKADAAGSFQWTLSLIGPNHDTPSVIENTSDGNYILAGSTRSLSAGGYDAFLLKTNTAGTPLWTKEYGGTDDEEAVGVIQTTDGGYALFGSTQSYPLGTFNSMYLLKTDSNGDTLWTKVIGGTNNDGGRSFCQAKDGGYVLLGNTQSYGLGNDVNMVVTKTDAMGIPLWTKHYGGTGLEQAFSIAETNDGGYVIAGSTYGFGAGGIDMYILRIDSIGDTLWTKTYGRSGYEEARCAWQTSDKGFIISGYVGTGSNDSDAVLMKIDSVGEKLWAKRYGATSREDGSFVRQTTDGGFIVSGHTLSFGSYDFYLVKTDSDGESGCFYQQNATLFQGKPKTIVTSVTALYKAGAQVGNLTFTSGHTGAEIDLCLNAGVGEEGSRRTALVYPNPFASQTTVALDADIRNASLEAYDTFGKLVRKIDFSGSQVIFQRDDLHSGIYFYRVISENGNIASGKFLVE